MERSILIRSVKTQSEADYDKFYSISGVEMYGKRSVSGKIEIEFITSGDTSDFDDDINLLSSMISKKILDMRKIDL